MSDHRLLTRRQVSERIGISRSAIYRMMRQEPPVFPLPVKISSRAVRWRADELDAWIESRMRATGDRPTAR